MLRTETLDFKVTVIKARFKDQKEFTRSLNPASRWQIMAFPLSPFFLNWVPSVTGQPSPKLTTQHTRASWQSRHTG